MKKSYWERRKDSNYYKFIRSLLTMLCVSANSICDVGSNNVDMISYLPCKKKYSIDLFAPLDMEGVIGIKKDFLLFQAEEKFDVITCFQVLEHISDENIVNFASKLRDYGKIAVVSVPYKWPKGVEEGHVQDPVDLNKFLEWFSISPIFAKLISENNGSRRLIAVFASDETTNKINLLNGGNFLDIFPLEKV